jgi:hypothetical protein
MDVHVNEPSPCHHWRSVHCAFSFFNAVLRPSWLSDLSRRVVHVSEFYERNASSRTALARLYATQEYARFLGKSYEVYVLTKLPLNSDG